MLQRGASASGGLLPLLGVGEWEAFTEVVVGLMESKLAAGLDVPCFPQLRDMNEMFLELLTGFRRGEGGLVAEGSVRARAGARIPELGALRWGASRLREAAGGQVFFRVCVTGPYTLSSLFKQRSPALFLELGEAVARVLDRSLFRVRGLEPALLSIDEPVLGFLADPLLDFGSEGREALIKALGTLARVGVSRGMDVSIHLHSTSDPLFWEVEGLGLVSSHVGDPLYFQGSTRRRLEERDMGLVAPVAVTQFDSLVEAYYRGRGVGEGLGELVGESWLRIKKGEMDPRVFLEGVEVMEERLSRLVGFFGEERVPYASPECGLGGFPDLESALECLRRASKACAVWRGAQGGGG